MVSTTYRLLHWNPSWLRDCGGGGGGDPEIYQIQIQSQAKQGDSPKETLKKCPIKVIHAGMTLSLSLSLSVCTHYPHVPVFLLTNTVLVSLLSVSLWIHF